jgi:APA family basic amino acid/polyamine antiporter
MSVASGAQQLQRAIGPRALAFATVNAVVGSGIFVLPALVSAQLGTAAILAYLTCGTLVLLIALCFAELGSATAGSGGLYAYVRKAFGPYGGFLAANLYWLGGSMVGDAAISNALAGILAEQVPALGHGAGRVLFLVALFGTLMAVNITGVRRGVRFVEFTAWGKLLPLIVLTVAALGHVDPANLRWSATPDAGSAGAASMLLFFAFLGFETPLCNGGEIKDPQRNVPRGLLLGMGLVLLLYAGIQCAVQGVLGAGPAGASSAPLGALAGAVAGAAGVAALVAVAAISMSGTVAGNMLCTPRILFAGACDGLMPPPLARVHPRFRTPYMAILVYGTMGCLLAIYGGFRQLALISSAAVMLIYLAVVLSLIRMRRTTPAGNGFRVPGGLLVPVVAVGGIVWLLSNLTMQEGLGLAVLIGALSVVYLFMVRARRIATSVAPTDAAVATVVEPPWKEQRP